MIPLGYEPAYTKATSVGVGGKESRHGRWTSQDLIEIAHESDRRTDEFIAGIIFHELAHVDEAIHVTLGNRALWKIHEYWLDGDHDPWTTQAGDDYTQWKTFEKQNLADKIVKPSINNAPWRQE